MHSRLATTVAGLALGFALAGPSAGPVPAGADTGVRRVGAIARAFPCGVDDAAIDPGLGLLIELNESIPGSDGCPNNAPAAFAIAAFSTSQLRLVARTQLAIQAGQSFEGATRSVVDAVHHRLFVATNGAGHDSVNVFSLPALLSAHGPVTPRVIALSGSPPAQSSHQNPTGSAGDATLGQAIGQIAADSIAYDPRTDALDVLTHATSSPTSTRAPGVASDVYVFEFNATSGKPLWTAFLGDCISAQSAASVSVGDQPAPLMRLRLGGSDVVAAGCLAATAGHPTLGSNVGSMLTNLIRLGADGRPSGEPATFLGRPNANNGPVDADNARLSFVAQPQTAASGSTSESPVAVVFDAVHQAYVGAVTVGSPATAQGGLAIASGGGRLYAVGPLGITLADLAATPIGQGQVFPEYSCFAYSATVDPATRRLFVRPYAHCQSPTDPGGANKGSPFKGFDVFEDDIPALTSPRGDPDSHTRDLAEQPGATVTSFSGHAAATGVRARLVGGMFNLVDTSTSGVYTQIFLGYPTRPPNWPSNRPYPYPPTDTSPREVDMAAVHSGDLDNFQASAAAVAVAEDQTTASELTQAGVTWPYAEVACSAGRTAAPPKQTAAPGGSATVTCDPANGVTTHAVAGPLHLASQPGPSLIVGSSEVTTSTSRDPRHGVVTSVTDTVHGLDVGPVQISAITATTTCHAHGRPGTATCSYARAISGIRLNGSTLSGGTCSGGGGDPCPQVVAALNNVLPGQLIFSTPGPDQRPDYLGGSPHGYQAVNQREQFEHLQDATLDADNSLQVPALRVLLVGDTTTEVSRLDLQLAGVQAEGHYGILPVTPLTLGGSTGLGVPAVGPPLVGLPAAEGASTSNSQRASPGNPGPGGGGLPAVAARAMERAWDGVKVLVRSPGTALLVSAVLAVLGAPLVAARRRRSLLEALQGGGP